MIFFFSWGSASGPILFPRILWQNWEDENLSKRDLLDWFTWCDLGSLSITLLTQQSLRTWQLFSPRGCAPQLCSIQLKAWRTPFAGVTEQGSCGSGGGGPTCEQAWWGQEQDVNKVTELAVAARRATGQKAMLPAPNFLFLGHRWKMAAHF